MPLKPLDFARNPYSTASCLSPNGQQIIFGGKVQSKSPHDTPYYCATCWSWHVEQASNFPERFLGPKSPQCNLQLFLWSHCLVLAVAVVSLKSIQYQERLSNFYKRASEQKDIFPEYLVWQPGNSDLGIIFNSQCFCPILLQSYWAKKGLFACYLLTFTATALCKDLEGEADTTSNMSSLSIFHFSRHKQLTHWQGNWHCQEEK